MPPITQAGLEAAVKELSETQLSYLTEISYTNHMAWVAIDLAESEEHGVGVARCIRLEYEPTVAEVGFTVVDSHQGRGLGTEFMHVMVEWACGHGIRTLRAYVLAENIPMLKLLRRFPTVEKFEEHGSLRVDMMLPPNWEPPSTSSSVNRFSLPAAP